MIIRQKENIMIVKILKQNLKNFNIFDQEQIKAFFQNLLIKIKEKYHIKGLLNIDVYIDNNYGMMIEITPIYQYEETIDIKIHFHLDCTFVYEINTKELFKEKEVYYYKNKYYGVYKHPIDSSIIYKTNDIFEKGIKVI